MKSLSKWKKELLQTHQSPEEIALAFAIGTLIAVLPTLGFGVLLGLVILFIHPKLNKISLFAPFAIFNPLVLVPIYGISYSIGNFLLGSVPARSVDLVYFDVVYQYTLRLIVGSAVSGIIISTILFFVIREIAKKYQKK